MQNISAETVNHLAEMSKLLGPFLTVIGVLAGFIVALIVWAWKKMEKTQEKLETAMTNHINSDDDIHDTLFDRQRETDEKLNNLIGQHEVYHP